VQLPRVIVYVAALFFRADGTVGVLFRESGGKLVVQRMMRTLVALSVLAALPLIRIKAVARKRLLRLDTTLSPSLP
jgi:hypothetical protein